MAWWLFSRECCSTKPFLPRWQVTELLKNIIFKKYALHSVVMPENGLVNFFQACLLSLSPLLLVICQTFVTRPSTLPNNPGDSRFWTVSPGVQIRVWNLPDNCRSLPFLEDLTFWQRNFKYFALFELILLLISNVSPQTPVCHWNIGNNLIVGK